MFEEARTTDTEIIVRYFAAVERLKRERIIRGLATITKRYGLNRWNVLTLRSDIEGHIGAFRASWVANLVQDYKVNPSYLLLGVGDFFLTGWDAETVKKYIKSTSVKPSKRK